MVPERQWFRDNQALLLKIANTDFGRDLLCIPKELPKIWKFTPESVHCVLDYDKWTNTLHSVADFRINAKYARVIRERWEAFNSFSRYFIVEHPELESPALRQALSLTAATLTQYPEAGDPGTSTMDASFQKSNATYATARNAATCDLVDGTATTLTMQHTLFGGVYYLMRCGFTYNTSALTSAATISACTTSFYISAYTNADSGGESLRLHSFTPASNSDFVTADYATANWGTTAYGTDKTFAGLSTSAFNDYAENATGLAAISKTGITARGLRAVRDCDGTTPGAQSAVSIAGADTALTTSDPKMVITYTLSNKKMFFALV